MMAYDNKFVLCVLKDGKPVREIEGKVSLPFHSEYKVRLKNKDSLLRAKAKVWIDGREVSNLGDFILQPNETLDLERFLDESMSSGRRFKFVPLGDGRVNDPTDPENGIIKVEFRREKRWNPPIHPCGLSKSFGPNIGGGGSSAGSPVPMTYTTGDYFRTSNIVSPSCDVFNVSVSNNIMPTNDSYVPENAGATVEGSHSGQSFVYGDNFQTEHFPVTLTIRVKAIDQREMDWEDRPAPRQTKKRIRFCPSCGSKRHGMAKFCQACGTAYHQRYERERGRIVR